MNAAWLVEEQGFHKEKLEDNGNKFLIGNGYMGVRGTLEEFGKEQLVAVNLAGIYDKVGDGWREPLNAPNPLFAALKVDGEEYSVLVKEPASHTMTLNYREAVLYRGTVWKSGKGKVQLTTQRFLDMENPHLIYQQIEITCDFPASVELTVGIDGDVWDIYGPHYQNVQCLKSQGILQEEASIQENRETVWVYEKTTADGGEETIRHEGRKILRVLNFQTVGAEKLTVTRRAAVYTTKDKEVQQGRLEECVAEIFADDIVKGNEGAKERHIAWWEAKWQRSMVEIEGDEEAMRALNYSLYHLHSIAPRHSDSLSIAARGLSGQTYKGAVFWDTEMFILDFFLYTEPEVAKTLLKYRVDTLEGAKKKAKEYGEQGAFYAWESQEGGFDACSDYNVTDVFTGRPMRTFFRDKQIHISSAIVHGIMRYVQVTGDSSLLEEGGAETILECASFYYGLLLKQVNKSAYELRDVIGPDEYHERVNNNGYTNRMAKFTFEKACWVLEQLPAFSKETRERIEKAYSVETLKEQYQEAAKRIYLPVPAEDGVIEQFDGYRSLEDVSVAEVRSRLLHEKEYWGGAYGVASHTQVIKQADVVTWLSLFPEDFSADVLEKNWEYYEPRTEHGSSLSACMYAWLACICGNPDKAYPFFMKSATADIKGGGKQWAGMVYIGGSHPAASGGAYMNALHGFAGVNFRDGELRVEPNLPSHWKKMKLTVGCRSEVYRIEIEGKEAKVTKIG